MKPDALLDKVKAKELLAVIDLRTPAEADVFTATLPDTLVIPANKLFSEASLTYSR
jgi:hypothetical protein